MMAKYFATSLAIENVVSAPRVISSCLPISTTSISLVGLESRSTMLPASRAACVPVFMATPTSAWASAGASLVPSPHIATSLPLACSSRISLQLVLGRRLGEEIVDAGFGGDRGGGHRVVAGDHDGADAHAAQLGEALADAALDDVLEVDDAEQPAVLGDGQRRAAGLGDLVRDRIDLARRFGADAGCSARTAPAAVTLGAGASRIVQDRIDRALADRGAADVDAAHAASAR